MAKPWVHRINYLIGSVICQPAIGRTVARVGGGFIHSRGLRINAQSPWINDQIKTSILFRLYERAEVHLIAKFLRSDLDVIELGASIGYTTLLISRKKPPRQVSVEANPRLINVIKANLDANQVNTVDLVHGAIDYSGVKTIEFRLSPDNLGSATLQAHERDNPAIRDEIAKVPVCTLSGLIERSKIGNYSLVCDIEGAEAGMILSETEEVRSRCQLMVIELHDTGVHEGKQYRVEELVEKIELHWGLRQVATNDRVFVFTRSPSLVH